MVHTGNSNPGKAQSGRPLGLNGQPAYPTQVGPGQQEAPKLWRGKAVCMKKILHAAKDGPAGRRGATSQVQEKG